MGQADLLKQVFLDNFLVAVFLYFPVFYTVKAMMQDGNYSLDAVRSGIKKYRKNFKQDNLASCSVWIPLDLLAFSVPMFVRLPLDHTISFGLTMIISYMR